MAARMKIAGIDDFVVLEKRPDLGGVWLDNSYPGAACDTESHLYCYSFHPHLRVSAMYAGRNELLHYLKSLATRFDWRNTCDSTSRFAAPNGTPAPASGGSH